MPQTQSPYLTQAQYDSKGKLSIMGNRPGVQNMYDWFFVATYIQSVFRYMQNPARPPASRIPNSPQANPYLRPNAQQR